MKNLFIVFDGMDGTGKSTQLSKLHDYLFKKDKRIRILTTREPTYGKYGKNIREMLEKHENPYSDSEKLLQLYVADRKDHMDNVVMPFLKKDNDNRSIVLCDRYYYSTLAYQGAQGVPIEKSIAMNQSFLNPDLALILDIPPKDALKRISRERTVEKFEKIGFMEKLRKNFHNLTKVLNENIVVIDTSGTEEQTFKKIVKAVEKIL